MRILVVAILTLISINLLAADSITHDVEKSALARSGSFMVMTVDEIGPEEFTLIIGYDIKTTIPFVGHQDGEFDIKMPIDFISEEGYINLENDGEMKYDNAIITPLGREDINGYDNCYKIRIDNTKSPRKEDRWSIDAYYHPSVASTGWVRSELTYKFLGVKIRAKSNIRN
jgi:hypothetical protein